MVNFHRTPFDQGTVTKLALFTTYAKEWMPVFTSPQYQGATVTIVDFFAGPGRDVDGREGSPLLLLRIIREYGEQIRRNHIRVRLELSEKAKRKAATLRAVMKEQDVPGDLCTCTIHNLPFEYAFDELYPRLGAGPNLLLLDQQGIKFIPDAVFQRVISLDKTDFMFFIASSFIRRFWDHEYFKQHLAIPGNKVTGSAFTEIHRVVTDYYRGLIPHDKRVFLAPFSIRKGRNIYGLVFGSAHTLGISKFLRVCWELDAARGEANFDIDGDAIDEETPYLFDEMNTPSKLSGFERALSERLLTGSIRSDGDVYEECLREGMLPRHGRTILRALIRDGRIATTCGRQPRVSEDGHREPRVLEVKRYVPV